MARPMQRLESMPMAARATPKRPHRAIETMAVMASRMTGTMVLL
jgi:hypothetical protein